VGETEMNMKGISIALILLGVAFVSLSLNQINSMMVSNAQSQVAMEAAEAQIKATEELAKSYGQSAADVSTASAESRTLLTKTFSKMNDSYTNTALLDGVLGLILLIIGVFAYPKDR
jgi:predicted metalloprotease